MTLPTCTTCGQVHERPNNPGRATCTAHSKQKSRETGKPSPCLRYPGVGGDKCRTHDGLDQEQRHTKAVQYYQSVELARTIGELADACQVTSTNPLDQLQESLEVSIRMVDALDYLAFRLAPGIGEGPDATKHVLMPVKAGAATNPLITELGTWVDRKARTAKACVDAGFSERQVRVMEANAGAFIQAIRAILAGLGLTPDQQALVPQLVRAAMAEIPVETS